jgi:hypothetical protein
MNGETSSLSRTPMTSVEVVTDEQAIEQRRLDEALEETFPASDPVAVFVHDERIRLEYGTKHDDSK